jgi:UDP-N-acetylmuramate--alanine ligase
LSAARNAYDKRVLVAFQPHRYTRTESLWDDFTRAFNKADVVLVCDIYAAGEKAIPGISSERLARAIAEHGHGAVRYVRDRAELAAELARIARPGDVVIALGAGDVNKVLAPIGADIRARAGKGAP